MASCVIHQDHEADPGWLVCRRAWGRLAGALRQIPDLCDELSGLGFVQRDGRPRSDDAKDRGDWADPIAHSLPAGPLNGLRNGAKVSGSPGRSAPIRIDPTDLTASARVFRLAGRPSTEEQREPCRFCREHHRTDLHPPLPASEPQDRYADQIGYTSAASTLDFWVRDWADIRGEGLPAARGVRRLSGWLLDRLDWACQSFMALDEFAEDVRKLSSALFGLAGYGAARPKLMEAACPGCHLLTLTQSYPDGQIECNTTDCERILTPEEYAMYVRSLIEDAS